MKNLLKYFGLSVLTFTLLYLKFNPSYHTDDDNQWIWFLEGIGPHHGSATPYFIFQNFILAHLYQSIPDFFDIFGFNWMHIFSQILFFSTGIYYINKMNKVNFFVAYLIVLSLSLYNFFIPQFSITPSLLFFSGLVFLSNSNHNKILYLITFLIFLWSSMVRIEAFVFTTLLALPSLLDQFKNRTKSIFIITSFIICISLSFLNNSVQKKQIENKNVFNGIGAAMGKLLDYGGVQFLEDHPEQLKGSGLSLNDLKIFGNWIFLDSDINKKIINIEFISKVKISFMNRVEKGLKSIAFLFHHYLIILFLLCLLVTIMSFSRTAYLSLFIFLSGIFGTGFLGREPYIRILIGPLIFLTILNIKYIKFSSRNLILLSIAFMFFLIVRIKPFAHISIYKERLATSQLEWIFEIQKNNNLDIYWWTTTSEIGINFYRMKNLNRIRDFKFERTHYMYGNKHDPFGEQWRSKFKNDFLSKGIFIPVENIDRFSEKIPILETYCIEHFSGVLEKEFISHPDKIIGLSKVKCNV